MSGATEFLTRDSLHIHEHARKHLIEQIMALAGRASKDPVRYRRILESYSFPTVQAIWQRLGEELADPTDRALSQLS